MEEKKSKKADLRNKSILFLEIGFVLALALVLGVFQFTGQQSNDLPQFGHTIFDYEPELIPITRPEAPKKELAKQNAVFERLVIVENPEDLILEDLLFTSEGFEHVAVTPIEFPEETLTDEVIYKADLMPEFEGGTAGLLRHISNHINYPEVAKENKVQGTVYVQFVVNKMGKVVKVRLLKGVDPVLNNEALRVVQELPNWSPGMQSGQLVNVAFTVPIRFELH